MPGRKPLPDLVGRTLVHYRILERIGEGGMGEVWLAEDLRLRRRVALKILPAALASEPRHLERFQREARSVACLNHPNIVTIHSVEESEGLHFLVLELVEGETLANLLAAGPLSLERILEIALPLVEALEAIHARGVIHRDLKPRNVMVSREGRVKLLDFGIARLTQTAQAEEEASIETTLTKAGRIVGTTPYMSPEQLQGRPVDHRTDLFSFGILLYEMATGQRPFRGKSQLSTAAAILYDTPTPPSDLRPGLPSRFDEIVSLCLAKEPFLRCRSATDLGRDLKNLTATEEPTLSPSREAGDSSSSTQRGTSPRLPARPRCFGRETEIHGLAEALCSDPPSPVPVLGPAGAGKTTITLAALHQGRVADRFGRRRWFVRCDGATGRDSLVGAIARTVCPDAVPPLEPKVFNVLENAPAVLALDNLETPWERETAEVEDLLAELAAIPGLALVAALHGEQRPIGPSWHKAIHADPLDLDSARNAFLAVAGERFQDDPNLYPLLLELDGLALAVVLLASQAEGEPDLSMLGLRWQEQRTALLRRAGAQERQQSLEVSLELSINSLRMTDESRRLLSILSLLPEGVAREDLSAVLPEHGIEAASVLRKVGLAFDQGSRLRMLAPVREYIRQSYPPVKKDLDRTVDHFLSLARLGEAIGTEGGAAAVQRLKSESGNLEPMLIAGLERSDPALAMRSALAHADFLRFTGQGSPVILGRALRLAQENGLREIEADVSFKQGQIYQSRSSPDVAEESLRQALSLYRHLGNLHGQARCIALLGEISLIIRATPDTGESLLEEARLLFEKLGDIGWEAACLLNIGYAKAFCSRYREARTRLTEARTIFQKVGDLRNEANSLQRLGIVSYDLRDFDQAEAEFQTAFTLARRVGSLQGEANSLLGLGQVAFGRGSFDVAQDYLKKALQLNRLLGSTLGEANCLMKLGETAYAVGDYTQAEELSIKARSRYRRIGHLLGEANCAQGLGELAMARSDFAAAQERFHEALALFTGFPKFLAMGEVQLQLARLFPPGSPERLEHVEAARRAWEEAGILDQRGGELEAVAQAGSDST